VRRRLLLVTLATTSLVVIAFAVPLAALVRDVARDRAVSEAERDVAALAPVLALADDPALVTAAAQGTATGADGRLAVFLPDGTQVGDGTPPDGAALARARDDQASSTVDVGGELVLYSSVVTGDGEVNVVRARIPSSLLTDGVATAWLALAGVGVALVGAAVVLADRLARSLTSEASALAATARAIAGGDPDARVEVGDTPELGEAARALNLLADRIGELRAAERERVADLSHRLRTPLTALRLDAEAAANSALVADVDRLQAAVTDLIRTARRPLHESPVGAACDLAAVVRERTDFWGALADDDGRTWTRQVPAGVAAVPVGLTAEEAAAAVDALIGNVFAHTPDGTPYEVALAVDDEAGTARFRVDDGGPGIDDPDAAVARGVTRAGTTGLGLDIARAAAEAAGGGLVVDRSPRGGARVELVVPIRRT
jgi:signal transduction histidine kinase